MKTISIHCINDNNKCAQSIKNTRLADLPVEQFFIKNPVTELFNSVSIGTKHSSPFHSITHSHAEITFHLMELVLHKDTPSSLYPMGWD